MTSRIKQIVYTGMFAAIIFVATRFLIIPTPFGNGYIHLGDCMIFLAAYHLGGKRGGLAAGIGSALADFLSPYAVYTIPTFIVKGIMGLIAGYLLSTKYEKRSFTVAFASVVTVWTGLILFLRNTLNNYKSMDTHASLAESLELADPSKLPNLIQTADIGLSLLIISVPTLLLLSWFLFKRFISNPRLARSIFASIIAGLWMVMGYFVVGYILYHSYLASVFSISFDVLQFAIGILISQLLLQVTSRLIKTA